MYVATAVVEFFTQSMLVIRWRRWLTDNFVLRWLARHDHYRISLATGQTDNPDQRIAEDVYRFINGGSDGSNTAYGIYDFSILLISTLSSLVSFAIVLWSLSKSFTLPGTDIILPGFLFWVALYIGSTSATSKCVLKAIISRCTIRRGSWRPRSDRVASDLRSSRRKLLHDWGHLLLTWNRPFSQLSHQCPGEPASACGEPRVRAALEDAQS